MASALLTQAMAAGKVVVRKGKRVSGEVVITFSDHSIPPVTLTSASPVILTDIPGIDKAAIQRSNVRKLQSLGLIDLVIS